MVNKEGYNLYCFNIFSMLASNKHNKHWGRLWLIVNLNLVYMHSRLGVSGVSKKWRKFGTKEMNRLFSFVLRFKLFVWHWADEKHDFTMQRRTGLWWRVIWSFSNYNCVVFEHKVMAKERKMQSNCSLTYVQALSCFLS